MTAIEWLIENSHIVPKNEVNKRDLIEQAKVMEKIQIIDSYLRGIEKYNETFKK
jgi:hypothetical protein